MRSIGSLGAFSFSAPQRGPFLETGFPLGFKEHLCSPDVEVIFGCLYLDVFTVFLCIFSILILKVVCCRLRWVMSDIGKQLKWVIRNIG